MDKHNGDKNRMHDEELFRSLDKNRKWKRRKILFTFVGCVLLLAVVGAIVLYNLKESVWNRFGTGAGEVLQARSFIGTIRNTVSGSGILADVDLEKISVPEGVEVLELLVKTNDVIVEGQSLAKVDLQSVQTAISQIQQQITALDAKIRDADDDEVSKSVLAGVSGRVKAIYAKPGAVVEQTVYENGALAVVSLDGYMAVEFETNDLSPAQAVSVRWSGGSLAGTVESVRGNVATVLFSDREVALDEVVTVCDLEGEILGVGNAYIHSPLRIAGFVGILDKVHVKVNDAINSNSRLFTLKDTQSRANYDTLLRQRMELEEGFLELLRIQHHGALVSTVSGRVYSINEDEKAREIAVISLDRQMSVTIDVDEADILSLELGQRAEVTVNSVGAEPFSGVVTKIDRTINGGAYSAEVTLDKAEGMLSGMTADVRIEIMCAENVVVLPEKAVNLTQTGAYVYTGYDPHSGKYENRVDVVLGLKGEGCVQIAEGLQAGETVFYTDAATVKDLFDSIGERDEHRSADSNDEVG